MCLDIKNLSVGYNNKIVVKGINASVEPGQVLAVLGANGCGKTTLMRTVLGIIPPVSGDIYVEGRNLSELTRKSIGRRVAYVPQNNNCTFSFPVREIAVMGRSPHIKEGREPKEADYEAADMVLDSLNIAHLKDRKFINLSGGEKKLVLIARALVQQPKLLVMDEPTSDLDLSNTVTVLEKIAGLKESDMSIIINTHSPKEAKVYADKTLMIKNGGVYGFGDVSLLSDPEVLDGLYSIDINGLSGKLSKFVRDIA